MELKPFCTCLALISLVTAVAVTAAGCTVTNNHNNMEQQTSQSQHTYTIIKGETLNITLPANHSTGYSWSVADIDNDFLVLAQKPTYNSSNANGIVGQTGQETFQFQSIATGQTSLKLVYQRPFESGVAPAKTHDATVIIQ